MEQELRIKMEMEMELLPPSLGRLVRSLQAIRRPTAEGLGALVEAAGVRAADLEAWAAFDHPVSDSYGRRLVHHGGHFELMVMSWRPGDFSGSARVRHRRNAFPG